MESTGIVEVVRGSRIGAVTLKRVAVVSVGRVDPTLVFNSLIRQIIIIFYILYNTENSVSICIKSTHSLFI